MNPHNFLLHLRNSHPWGARLFDGLKGLGLAGSTLEIKIDTSDWPGSELSRRADELGAIASKFFDREVGLSLMHSPADAEHLPFPVTATKYWNHVAFLHLGEDGAVGVFGLRKTAYAEMLKGDGATPGENAGAFTFGWPSGGNEAPENHLEALPGLLDLLAATARAQASYVQLVTPFPGHERAEALEGRYCSIKEWGTPTTPSAILQKYAGRIHYLTPQASHRGLSLAKSAAGGGG